MRRFALLALATIALPGGVFIAGWAVVGWWRSRRARLRDGRISSARLQRLRENGL